MALLSCSRPALGHARLTSHLFGMQIINESWVSEGAAEGLGTTFFLDGARTRERMATCAEWFAEASQLQQQTSNQAPEPPQRILLFNCVKVQCRCMSHLWHPKSGAMPKDAWAARWLACSKKHAPQQGQLNL